ncbi:MAG TPA: PIG-L family deacetylase [Candidatus Hydrogenedentes bacterium]|nr:PIG-L family deacetylase [Candidatus Hydrogenedentota bacterium]
MRVMAFGAHPDDVEILCAGTLAKYANQGHAVAIAVATNGEVGSPTLSKEEIAAIREQEARKAAAIINADFYWLGYPDEFLYDTPEVRRHFIDVIRQFRPDIILCPDKDNDYHPDHQRTGQIVWETHVMTPVPNIVTAHPPCEKIHEIWFYDTIAGINFTPEIYVDITETWETKMAMLSCHKSQADWLMAQYGMLPNYFAETQSRFRGYQTGCTFAEAFRKAHVYPSTVAKDGLLPV